MSFSEVLHGGQAAAEQQQRSPVLMMALLVAVSYLFYRLTVPPSSLKTPKTSQIVASPSTFPFYGLGSTQFYSDRWGFLRRWQGDAHKDDPLLEKRAVRCNCSNKVLITSHGADAAETFFHDRNLSFSKGYSVMFAGIPQLPAWLHRRSETEVHLQDDEQRHFFQTQLKLATNSQRLDQLLPQMFEDSFARFAKLPKEGGLMDMHKVIYPLIFQISVRNLALAEDARDEKRCHLIEKHFWAFQDYSGFFQTHFPLLPLPGTIKRWYGIIRLTMLLKEGIESRRREGRREDDHIQTMIDAGHDTQRMINFIIGGLFAAIINTTGMLAWTLVLIAADPPILARVREELDDFLRKEAEARGDEFDELSVEEQLSRVPIESWESNLPYFDACLKETMRYLNISVLFRAYDPKKKGSAPTVYGGEQLREGEYVSFWLAGTHLNPDIYPNPLTYDPDRYFVRKEGSGPNEFLGWGAGLHPCTGMRFAKLEIKTCASCFLRTFPDYKPVDLDGNPYNRDNVPLPDLDSEHRRFPDKPLALAYTRRFSPR
ncbi:cytochrome P450 [Violaceomyces palustris]|uniref:Cytochrome P450 n=1 Tax=Violaceomyces palustris TaxID=1673888 RepID=A0ACD0NPR4_9BASI|nr:cytochrome P450 [Violaceomyces palustris]